MGSASSQSMMILVGIILGFIVFLLIPAVVEIIMPGVGQNLLGSIFSYSMGKISDGLLDIATGLGDMLPF